MSVELIIEALMAVLLIATCSYCYVLSQRLNSLRAGQKELLASISKFDDASRIAERNLALMQSNGSVVNRELSEAAASAHSLIDELSVMVHAGDNIACRIEGAVNEVRMIGRQRAANEQRRMS